MADEFVDRYHGLSHEVLYARLQAGDPETIANAAAKWQSASATVRQICDDLNTDLAALTNGWSGSSSEEYQRRLGLVSVYALNLSESQDSVKEILNDWSTILAEAQAKAETPETVENEAGEAYTEGASSFFAVSPALGDQLGHQQADEVIEAAHERMVQLVVDLAVVYSSTADRFPTAAEPDPDMPGADVPLSSAHLVRLSSGDDNSVSSAIYAAGSTGGSSSGSTAVSYNSGDGSSTGSGTNAGYTTGDGTTLTTLAGVDGDGVVTLATTGAVGAGGVIMSQASLSTTGITGTTGGLGLPLASTGSTLPAGGVLASAKPTTTKAITPTISENTPNQSTTTRTIGNNPNTNTTNDDEDDEYTTWLTEDNMDWGDDDQNLPPAVLQ